MDETTGGLTVVEVVTRDLVTKAVLSSSGIMDSPLDKRFSACLKKAIMVLDQTTKTVQMTLARGVISPSDKSKAAQRELAEKNNPHMIETLVAQMFFIVGISGLVYQTLASQEGVEGQRVRHPHQQHADSCG